MFAPLGNVPSVDTRVARTPSDAEFAEPSPRHEIFAVGKRNTGLGALERPTLVDQETARICGAIEQYPPVVTRSLM